MSVELSVASLRINKWIRFFRLVSLWSVFFYRTKYNYTKWSAVIPITGGMYLISILKNLLTTLKKGNFAT